MASPRPWPFDADDRPSGSVRPLSHADLQAILAHLEDDPDQLPTGTSAGRPVLARRVRASVGQPGGSAHAQWRRLRAAEWAAWTQTLPWRVAVILGIGAAGGVLGRLLVPQLSLLLGALAAVAVGWRLRFQPSSDAVAWRRERRGSGAPPGPAQSASVRCRPRPAPPAAPRKPPRDHPRQRRRAAAQASS